MEGSLQSLAGEVDERRYVSRAEVAERIEALLRPDSSERILVLHGPGGIGKSAVLREIARRASAGGYSVLRLDGRRLAEVPELAAYLSGALPVDDAERLVLLIDEIDSLGAGLHSLGAWIAGLPGTTRIAVAGRARPARGWAGEDLEALSVTHRLGPLNEQQSYELLRRLELDASRPAEALVRWAMGSPLALIIAARATAEGRAAEPFVPELLDDLIERIAGVALGREDREVLRAASISWSVDEALLAAVLPDRDGARSLARLIELDFVERLGERAVVHPIVARAVTERMQAEDPRLLSSLTLRTASHLRDRAVDGDGSALADMANLVRDPTLRDGLGPAFSEDFYADRPRAADAEAIRSGLGEPEAALWPAIEARLRSANGECFVARGRSGECVGVCVAFGVRSGAPVLDRLSLPLVEFAARLEQPERAVISPLQLAFGAGPGEGRRDLMRFMNAMAVMRCGVPNPRYDIVNGIGWTALEEEVARRYGYEEITDLRRTVAPGLEVRTWFADSGGGGLAGLIYAAIADENGIEIASEDGWPDLVLEALEKFHDDAGLASLPVAPHGHDQAAAAAIVRARLRAIVDRAFAADPELRAIVEARYFTPGQSHDGAMRAMFQSRSSYYRKLRRAREAIVAAA